MANKKFITPDGRIETLPDDISSLYETDLEEFIKQRDAYAKSYNQPSTFSSTPDISEFVEDKDIAKVEPSLARSLATAQGAYGAGLGMDAITMEGDRDSFAKIFKGSVLREEVQNPAIYNVLNAAPQKQEAEEERNNLLSLSNPTTEQKDRIEELTKILEGTGKSIKEEERNALLDNQFALMMMGQGPMGAYHQGKFLESEGKKRAGLNTVIEENLDTIQETQKYLDSLNYTDSYYKLAEADGFVEGMETFASDPYNLMVQITGSSGMPMLKSLGAGVLATSIAGPVAGGVASGFTSGSIDASYSFIEYMTKKGMDINDINSVALYMSNKELVNEAKKYAKTRGITIGTIDGLTFGLATKMLAPANMQNLFAKQALNAFFQTGIQVTGGAGGEYLAQLFTLEDGETIRPGEIIMEGVGEIALVPVEVTLGQVAAGRQHYARAQAMASEKYYENSEVMLNILRGLSDRGIQLGELQNIETAINRKTAEYIKTGENPFKAKEKASKEVLEKFPGYTEGWNIYKDFTNNGQNPENFPFQVETKTTKVPSFFTVRKDIKGFDNEQGGTFTILNYDGTPLINPNTNQTYTYTSEEKAKEISGTLNVLSNTQYAISQSIEYMQMQNLNYDNPFVKNLGLSVVNPFYDGISSIELKDIGVNAETIQELRDATGGFNNIPIQVLKDNLSKKQFDKIMTARGENLMLGETSAPPSISLATFKKLFKNKNVEFDPNSDAFKKLALQYTAETDINKMSIAQKRVLYSVINRLPSSPELIPLPDFSNRSYSLNDYNNALQAITETNKPTLKTIREATGLKTDEAKKLRQDLITAGYVEQKGNAFKFLGIGNKKIDVDGALRTEDEIERNQQVESLIKDFNEILPEAVSIKMTDYLRDFQGNLKTDKDGNVQGEGLYNPVFDQVFIAIDNAGVEYKNNPKEYLDQLAGVLGHESWHALRQADVFTEAEYQTLINAVTNTVPKNIRKIINQETGKNYTAEEAQNETYLKIAEKEYAGQSGYDNYANIVEEAIARFFQDYAVNKKNASGKPQNIFKKVETFFEKTVNALEGNGFQTATSLIDKVYSGEIGKRKTRKQGQFRTTLELDRINSTFQQVQNAAINAGFTEEDRQNTPIVERALHDSPQLKYSRKRTYDAPPRIFGDFIGSWLDNDFKVFSDELNTTLNNVIKNPEEFGMYLNRVSKQYPNARLTDVLDFSEYITRSMLEGEAKQNEFNKVVFFVGDINPKDQISVVYDDYAKANKAAQVGNQYQKIYGKQNKVRAARLNFANFVFHPLLFNLPKRPTKTNPYKKLGMFGVDTDILNRKLTQPLGNPPLLINNAEKLSLARTQGRITPDRELDLINRVEYTPEGRYQSPPAMWDSLPDKYDDYDRTTEPLIDRVIRNVQDEGSESIAAILENDENHFINVLGLDMWNRNTVEKLQDDINFITEEALKYFPEQIVVYRGGDIKEEYDIVPVTFNQLEAETFTDYPLFYNAREDSLEDVRKGIRKEDGSLVEYIIPKEKILAYINPLMVRKSSFNFTSSVPKSDAQSQYKFFNEGEFLVNKNDLIKVGDPVERIGPRFRAQNEYRVERIKEQAREILDENASAFLMGGPQYTTEFAPDDVYQLLIRQLKTKLNNLSNKRLNREELIKLLTDSALQEAELRLYNQPETAYKYGNTIKSYLFPDQELETRKNKYLPQLIKKAEDYAEGVVNTDRKAVIAIGLPASGKSHFAEKIAKEKGASIVDSDDAKKILPEYGTGLGANALAVESSALASTVLTDQISKGNNIIIPKVGGSNKNNSLMKTIDTLKDNDYSVDVILVDADFNAAITRVLNRFVDTGRYIPSSYLLDVENSPRDTYNYLKRYGNVDGFAFINNNFAIGEQTLEEDSTGSYEYLAKRTEDRTRNVGVGVEQDATGETTRLLEKAEAEKQKSIEAGVTPVINTNADPDAVVAAVKAQEDIKNTPSEYTGDVNFILSDIGQNNKIKYSFKNSGKPLKTETERLVQRLTVRDQTPDDLTIGQIVLQSTNAFDPLSFREQILDQYARLAETDVRVAKETEIGDKIMNASVSAAAALYHSDRSGDIFQQSFLRGVPVYDKEKGYTYVSSVSQLDGEPIVAPYEIFKEAINDPNMLWAFQAVLRVQRETRFDAEGRKVKITAQDKKDAAQALKDYPQLQTMIDQYQRWNSHVVQFLVDTGVLDQKTGDIWMQTSDYIPFYRPLEGMEGFKGPKIMQGLSITPFKRAKGSEEKDIVDPITGITNNLRAAINVGMKNIAANRVMRNLELLGIANQVKGNVKGPNIVQIKVNGKTTSWKVDDPTLFNSFTMMSGTDYQISNFLGSISTSFLRGSKQAVSEFITRMPDFWVRQIIRDSMSAWALSGANYTPILSSIKEAASITYGMMTGNLPEEFQKLKDAGIITGYDKGVRQIDSTEKLIKNLYKKERKKQRSTIKKIAMSPFDSFAKVWEIMGQGTAITDAATRVAVYKDTLKRTGSEAEAIFQAQEVLNFTRRGNNPFVQWSGQTIMFLNPRAQGLDVFYRGVSGKYGIERSAISPRRRILSVLARFSAIAASAAFYYALLRDSEEYEEADPVIKDNFIIIPGSKKLFGFTLVIPKPFEVGLIAFTIPEKLIAYLFDDVAGKDVADSIFRNLRHTFAITPPTAITPIYEVINNKNLFTGREIVPEYLQGVRPDVAYRQTTSILAREVGNELDVSPLYIENIIRGYTGTLGTYVMLGVDSLLREGLTQTEKTTLRVDQLPFIGAFVIPPEGRGLETQFYDLKRMTDTMVKTFNRIEKNLEKGDKLAEKFVIDDVFANVEYVIAYNDALKDLQSDLQKISDQLTELRNTEEQILNSDMSGDAKRDALVSIQDAKNELLKAEQISAKRKTFIQEVLPALEQR